MAAINFPSSPADGETFTYSGKTFEWSAANGIWFRKPNGPLQVLVEEPTLSGVTTANELSDVVLTISNYNNTLPPALYSISVTGGSFIRVDDTITWTLPSVLGDTIHSLYIYATIPSSGISTALKYDLLVSEVVLNLETDTSIIISDFSTDSSSINWDI